MLLEMFPEEIKSKASDILGGCAEQGKSKKQIDMSYFFIAIKSFV